MTTYEWDTRCADIELERLQDGFTSYDHINFARVLMMGFARVQNDVHVQSGRLRASGDANVETSTPHQWAGEISFGGGRIRYAASEFFGYADAHGGYPSHAYFRRVGWQPTPRFGDGGEDVPWSQQPIGNVQSGSGVPIEDDMIGPLTSFISRGRNTVHPEGPIR
jgi:hypothetical protein